MTSPSQQTSSQPRGDQFLGKAAVAGGVGAFVSTLLNPVDVAKVRMQNHKPTAASASAAASGSPSPVVYRGLTDAMRRIVREEGLRGLARGLEASIWREIVYSSLRMGWYEPIRKALSSSSSSDGTGKENASPAVKYLASLISGGTGSALANPFDLVKTRFQATLPHEPLPYRHTLHALQTIHGAQGLGGLYRGWAVTSARAAVLTSAQLGTYDSIKHNLLINRFGFQEGFGLHFVCSMIASVITTTASNPFDVIKTRYLSDAEHKYKSVGDCVMQTYRGEGLKGFMRGWTPAYFRIGPHTMLTLMLIEEIRSLLGMNNI